MQASTWANGQLVAQPTHRPHFNPNTHNNNGSNRLYIISNGGSLVGHFAIQQTSAQRENATNFHQGYHPNSTQSPTLAYPPDVTVIPAQELQVRCPQNTSMSHNLQNTSMSHILQNMVMSQNPQSVSVPNSDMGHFLPQSTHQGLTHVNVKSQTENVPAPLTKPTSPSTTHAVYNRQQLTLIQSLLCHQSSQQTGTLPSYYEALVSKGTSDPHHVSSSQVNNVSPVTSTSWSNQPDQTNYVLPQTVIGCTLEEVQNGSGHRSTLQAGHNKAYKIQGHTLQANGQVNSGVQGNIAASVGQPSPSSSWPESTPVPAHSQTQANMSTTKPVVNPPPNLVQLFYQKMNEDLFEKNETVKASNGATLTSPSRTQRAVAVVLPLLQDNSMEDNLSKMIKRRLLSGNPQKKNSQQHITESHMKETEKVDLGASCSTLKKMLTMVEKVPNVSHAPLSFSKLVKGTIPKTLQNKMPGNGKTPKEQQSVAETSSSISATEWTFQMLLDKIVEMEKEYKKSKKVLDPISDQSTVEQLVVKFWNGNIRTMVATAKKGDLFNKLREFKDLCRSTGANAVVLSHTKSKIDEDRYHVLQHGEKVEKIPFTSSWLNTNPQLDDIDNEFGLPYFFTCAQRLGDWKDSDPQKRQNDKSLTGLQFEKSVEPMENEGNDTLEEICNESLDSKTKDCDENECDTEMLSSDSSYSFQIEILPPEKAKVIFDQEDCDAEPQVEHFQAEETLPTDHDDAKKQTCNANSIEIVCCMDKWKEKVFGFSSEGKCKCNEEQSADNSLRSSIFDLTEENPCSPTAMEDIQEGNSPNSIIVLSESDDELQVLEKNQMSQSTDGPHVISSGQNALETLKHLLNMADATVSETSCEMQEQEEGRKSKENPIAEAPGKWGPSVILNETKAQEFQSTLASSSKCKNTAPKENVELAIFGSNTGQMASTRTRRRNVCIFDETLPPERIYVKMDPLSTSDKGAELSSNVSVRKRIHENWRKSFPHSTIKILKKNKKFSMVGAIPVPRFHKPDAKRMYSKRKLHDSNNPVSHKKTAACVGRTQNLRKTQNVAEVKSPQEGALTFNVLSDFNFKEVSKNEDSRTDSAADGNTVIDKNEEQTPALKKRGLWREELGHLPQAQSSSGPESHGLFQEFKRRHKMKQKSPE
ncbi:unnamed protein product [Knipowitschia caucasica]